jgi:hypothetical protein
MIYLHALLIPKERAQALSEMRYDEPGNHPFPGHDMAMLGHWEILEVMQYIF